ncbi:MAG: SMC family ATPase [Rhodococcus sp.]|nr:SMC family ATPase [Rhodococcus sp. (in: high G+C Gram-positive bacteria)]
MRLHQLEITSFGPFSETVCVDFDKLGADGLFLLHGQTGAGKTTVLDAVAFALYGTVPGARKDGKRLLSDHAPQGATPTVSLEATVGGRRIRVIRSPEFERAKKRGDGTVKQQAKATLEWLDGSGENLSRIPDIAAEISRLVGMTADQFFQVVLLPQGEFARFLRADSDERGVLLERLFDTFRFGSVEEWFKNQRKLSEQALSEQRRGIDDVTSRIMATAGIEAGADADPLTWAQKLLDEAVLARDESAAAKTEASAQLKAANDALTQGRTVRDRHVRKHRALDELNKLKQGNAERERYAQEAAAARRAAPVASAEADAKRQRAQAQADRQRVDDITARLHQIPGAEKVASELTWPPTGQSRNTIRDAIRQWQNDIVRLDDAVQQSREADALESESAQAQASIEQIDSELAQVSRELAELPENVEHLRSAVIAAEKAAEIVSVRERERREAAEVVAAVDQLTQLAAAASKAAAAEQACRTSWNSAREQWLTLREQRINGMAAELAAGLEDGQPCAVCGSCEHPQPASATGVVVSEDDEQAAQRAEQRTHEKFNAAASAAKDANAAVERVQERVGTRDADSAHTELAAASAAYNAATAAADELSSRQAALNAAVERSQTLAARKEHLGLTRAEVSGQIESRRARIQEIRAKLAQVAGTDSSVTARRARLDQLEKLASTLVDARDDALRSETAAAEADSRVRETAAEAGFADVADALAAVRTDQQLAEIDGILSAARDREVSAQAVLEEPEIAALADDIAVDVDDLAQRAQQAADAEADAIAAAAETERTLSGLERYGSQLRDAMEKIGPVQARHDQLAALADVVAGRGANIRKMSLSAYVLAARLEEVAASASVRLRRMSGGRYEFVHSDSAGSHGKRGGLGLDIRDDFTGAVRSAKTLSGGESFLASLSLALGLADVVAAESGGVVLDTMFIDEGFGTLDADTLDAVMGVLDELRDGGRVVGIVSHVDEMRQRIPSRLHVIRGRTGSHLETIAS